MSTNLILSCVYSISYILYSLDSTDSANNSTSDGTKTSNTTENDEQLDTRPPSNTSSEIDSSSGVTRYL